MHRLSFNPANFLINLALGWFIMSFLQALVRAIALGNRGGLIDRFKAIAFFHDRPAGLLNLAIMAGIWILTTALWFTLRQK